jgi:hypothetical protein
MSYNWSDRRRELAQNDPDWAQRERARAAKYVRERMRNDPEWREKVNAYRRQCYADNMQDPEYRVQRAARARQQRAKQKRVPNKNDKD